MTATGYQGPAWSLQTLRLVVRAEGHHGLGSAVGFCEGGVWFGSGDVGLGHAGAAFGGGCVGFGGGGVWFSGAGKIW